MLDTGNAVLFARMGKIERENRILKRGVAFVALALCAVLVMAQTPNNRPRTLEAEKLIIRYPNGKAAIVLEASDRALALLFAPDGSQGVQLESTSLGNNFRVQTPNADSFFSIDAAGGQTSQLVHSASGSLRLSSGQDGAAMRLLDDKNNPRAVLGNTKLGLANGSVEARALSSLLLFDKEGKVLWGAP